MADSGPLVFEHNTSYGPEGLNGLGVGGGGLIVSTEPPTMWTPQPPQPAGQLTRRGLQDRAMNYIAGSPGFIVSGETALTQLAAGSTVLPTQAAEFVTALSMIARVSLRSSAFLIEATLEAAKAGTGMGLGLTRRTLIAAITSARAQRALRKREDWRPEDYYLMHTQRLTLLDRYTMVGASLVQSAFTMADLLSMSGFYLVDAGVKAGIAAADETVKLIDGIFGSNETSRALASIITLVQREFTRDEKFNNATGGALWGLVALTKAITTFAVLQNSTYRRTVQGQHQRVLYDCTILGRVETRSWKAMIVGPASFVKRGAQQLHQLGLPPMLPERTSSQSGYDDDDNDGDVQRSTPRTLSRKTSASFSDSDSILENLEHLLNDDDKEKKAQGMSRGDSTQTIVAHPRSRQEVKPHELPEQARRAVKEADEAALRKGIVVEGEDGTHRIRRVVRKRGHGLEETFEITTETVEVVETTTLFRREDTPEDDGVGGKESKEVKKTGNKLSRRLGNAFKSNADSTRTDRDVTKSLTGTQTDTVGYGRRERTTTEEEEWLEVTHTSPCGALVDANDSDTASEGEGTPKNVTRLLEGSRSSATEELPELPNGMPATSTDGADQHDDGKQRRQYTLRTMTRKLIKKKRVVRRVELEDGSDEDTPSATPPLRRDENGMAWLPRSASPTKHTSEPVVAKQQNRIASGGDIGAGLQRALNRAKKTVLGNAGSSTSSPRLPSSPDTTMTSPNIASPMSPNSTPPQTPRMELDGNEMDQTPVQVIPPRRASRAPLASVDAQGLRSMPVSPDLTSDSSVMGSNAAAASSNKRRSRAMSISSVRSFASRSHTHTQVKSNTKTLKNGPGAHESRDGAPGTFPRQHLVVNLRRFMRHASASYGQNFMRTFDISKADAIFADTTQHHSNIYAFCHHVGIPVDHMLLSSFTEGAKGPLFSQKMSPIVNYITIDEDSRAVVLTCRGTLDLTDILTDLTCDYEDIWPDGGTIGLSYKAHAGMAASARRLCSGGLVRETLRRALEARPDYGLVLTGHSMGGGVAALLALLWASPSNVFKDRMLALPEGLTIRHPRITTPFVTALDSGLPPGRAIHAYGYGIPAVTSADLSRHCKGLVTSIVHGFDVVPSLSLGILQDMKNVAQSLSDERESVMAKQIVGRVVGLYRRRHTPAVDFPDEADGLGKGLPRPPDVPAHERELAIDLGELAQGCTRNRAEEAGYSDPRLSAEPEPAEASASKPAETPVQDWDAESVEPPPGIETDAELSDWLWSLVKTMRADMTSYKLYPPGQVYCIETFQVYVTPRMARDYHLYDAQQREKLAASRNEAHRVILRHCEDVEKRFGEPIFSRSMLRDHAPTSYELAVQLLWESVLTPEEQERMDTREAYGRT